MPILDIGKGQPEGLEALEVYATMLFPRERAHANEFKARARLQMLESTVNENYDPLVIKDRSDLLNLGESIRTVLESSYTQKDFNKLVETRRKRGHWSAQVLFQLYKDACENSDASIKSARIVAHEILGQAKKAGMTKWTPETKKEFGDGAWTDYRGVSHLWLGLARIFWFVYEVSDEKIGFQKLFVSNFRHVLNLAKFIQEDIDKRRSKPLFNDPHVFWYIPEDYPLPPLEETFGILAGAHLATS